MPPIIRFDHVTVTSQHKTILSEVSFALDPGQKASIYGKSGAGKSSLLKTLLGLFSATSGTVYFQEQALNAQVITAVRRNTAYIGQEPILGADTVRNALLLPFEFQAHREQRPNDAQLKAVLQDLHLPSDMLKRETHRISGGEKQRIALARGLLLGKTVYLLDEVTSALDAESKQAVFKVFADPHLTVLAVTHDNDWLQRSTITFEMNAGQLTKTSLHGNS